MIQSESTMSGTGRTPGRNSKWMERQGLTGQEREDGLGAVGERRRGLESSEYARGGQGSLERHGGLTRVVLLTPEGGQLINIGIGRGLCSPSSARGRRRDTRCTAASFRSLSW
jgi:hypothetical protein